MIIKLAKVHSTYRPISYYAQCNHRDIYNTVFREVLFLNFKVKIVKYVIITFQQTFVLFINHVNRPSRASRKSACVVYLRLCRAIVGTLFNVRFRQAI